MTFGLCIAKPFLIKYCSRGLINVFSSLFIKYCSMRPELCIARQFLKQYCNMRLVIYYSIYKINYKLRKFIGEVKFLLEGIFLKHLQGKIAC